MATSKPVVSEFHAEAYHSHLLLVDLAFGFAPGQREGVTLALACLVQTVSFLLKTNPSLGPPPLRGPQCGLLQNQVPAGLNDTGKTQIYADPHLGLIKVVS
jgi:hypothetical protein